MALAESEKAMIHHFETEHQDDVKELTLGTWLSWSETKSMGIASCPLCSSYGREDSPEIIDHILRHVYDFSLRALLWTQPLRHHLSKPIGTFSLPHNRDLADSLVEWQAMRPEAAAELQLSALEGYNHDANVVEDILTQTTCQMRNSLKLSRWKSLHDHNWLKLSP